MSSDIPYSALERKTVVAYHQDGLLDVIIGLGLVLLGMGLEAGSFGLALLAGVPILGYGTLKERITLPRLGYARFSARRSGPWAVLVPAAVALLAVLVSGGVTLLFAERIPPSAGPWLGRTPVLALGLVGAIIFGGAARLSGIGRLNAYALVALVLICGGGLLGLSAGALVATLGAAIILVGIRLLVRFTRRYEVVEVNDGS